MKFGANWTILDGAASHAYIKLAGAIEFRQKTRNSNLEAKEMIWSADMFTIVFPAQENGIEEKMR